MATTKTQRTDRRLRFMGPVLRRAPLALALSGLLLCATPHAMAQAGPSMGVTLAQSGFKDNDGSRGVTLGDEIDFTTIATNSGGVPLHNVQITDNFGSISCGTLNMGAKCTLTTSHIVDTGDVQAKQVVDQATAFSTETGSVPSNTSSTPGVGVGFGGLIHLSPDEAGVLDALENACTALESQSSLTPAQQDLLRQCHALAGGVSINPGNVEDAIDQLLPHDALLQTSASVLVTEAQFQNVKARMAALRSGAGGGHFAGLAFNGPDGTLPIGAAADALLGAADGDGDGSKETGAGFDRWGFFATGSFSRGGNDARTATPGYGFRTGGITAGVDYRYNDHWIFGLSAGYDDYGSKVDFVGGGLHASGWSLSAYSTWFRKDDWYVDGVVTYAHNTYDIDRRIFYIVNFPGGQDVVNQSAQSSTDGHTFAGTFTLGRDFAKGPVSYGPYLRGSWTRTDFGGYTETMQGGSGSGLGLLVDGRHSTSVESILGAKLNVASSQKWGIVIPHIEAEWVHEFENTPDSLNARFLQDPTTTPFRLHGDPVDQDFFRVGLGVSFQFSHGRSGFVYSERTLGISGLTQGNISAGFRMEF